MSCNRSNFYADFGPFWSKYHQKTFIPKPYEHFEEHSVRTRKPKTHEPFKTELEKRTSNNAMSPKPYKIVKPFKTELEQWTLNNAMAPEPLQYRRFTRFKTLDQWTLDNAMVPELPQYRRFAPYETYDNWKPDNVISIEELYQGR